MLSNFVNLALAQLITTALALPTSDPTSSAPTLMESQVAAIAPKSSSCAGASFPSECRTAAQVCGPISASFVTYGLSTPGEQAAVLSIIAFESDDFQYQINHFPAPGHPGQGTRNMQSAIYNLKYAQSIPELKPNMTEINTSDVTAILKLLTYYSNYDFGSGAWFLATQCDQSVRSGLQSGSAAGFTKYLECIGTTETSDKDAYYQRAKSALGVKNS